MSNNFWQGKLVRLRATESTDWQTHFEWDQDSEMYRPLDRVYFPIAREVKQREWQEKVSSKEPQGDNRFLEIENFNDQIVGSIDTNGCNPRTGVFSYGISIRREHQRKGYANEAIKIVLRYYFEELRYQKVNVQVHSYNEASRILHEKLGFVKEGTLRRMVFTKGCFFDLLLYGMTSEEFSSLLLS